MQTNEARGLLGVLAASGCLAPRRGPVKTCIRATLIDGAGNRDFFEEKVNEVRSFVDTSAEIRSYQTSERASGKRTTNLRFRFSSPALQLVYNLLYPNGEKEITRPMLDLLGGRGAAWYWAQHARPCRGGFVLSRVGHFPEEAALLGGWLELLTGGSSELELNGRRPALFFPAQEAAEVQEKLLCYAPQSRRWLFLPREQWGQ